MMLLRILCLCTSERLLARKTARPTPTGLWTKTYFEGEAQSNPQAKRGYSRDQRPDCKQVCIALVVTKEGIPLGYEIFDGNRHDSTTVQEIVEKMEAHYGAAGPFDIKVVKNQKNDTLPDEHQRILLQHLRLNLPARVTKNYKM